MYTCIYNNNVTNNKRPARSHPAQNGQFTPPVDPSSCVCVGP